MASVGYAGLLAVQCSSEGPYVGGGAGGSFSAVRAGYTTVSQVSELLISTKIHLIYRGCVRDLLRMR